MKIGGDTLSRLLTRLATSTKKGVASFLDLLPLR